MMLTQRISVLAHDLAKQCKVGGLKVEDKSRPKRSHSSSDVPSSQKMDMRRLQDYYELGETIGNGGFGAVYAGTSLISGNPVAIKVIPKSKVYSWSKIGSKVVPKEIALLHGLKHNYIIRMLDYFEDANNFYIVMERPEKYIDLFDYITQKGTVSERSARYLFRQTVEAVQYCLSMGVVHRDVKDENILIDLKSNQVKLIDFGSGTFLQEEAYTVYEGTRVYCPPEWVLKHRYHAVPATVWSLGILLYDMLQGDVPFDTESDIVTGHLPFETEITPEARSLILWMLSYRPEDRPTIDNILNHPWMKMTSSSSSSANSSRSASPAGSSTVSGSATTSNYQSPMHKSTAMTSSSTTSPHHLHPHHNHHNHHHYPHHRAPMPSPQLVRQVAPRPVKNKPVSPYLTRAALAVASCTPPTQSRSQTSLSSSTSSPSSSPRSPALLSSASRVSLGTPPNNSGGSSVSLLSTGSAASLTGLKSGSRHSIGGGASLDPSSPKIPLMNNRRSRLQAASRRK